jgi:hypothetical protein
MMKNSNRKTKKTSQPLTPYKGCRRAVSGDRLIHSAFGGKA